MEASKNECAIWWWWTNSRFIYQPNRLLYKDENLELAFFCAVQLPVVEPIPHVIGQ